LNECSKAQIKESVFKIEDRINLSTSNQGRKESWQTIVWIIRAAASKVAVNKLRAVKVVDRKPAAVLVSRVAREMRADSKVNRVASSPVVEAIRTTANS
jgi:hypothetical protein